MNKSCSSSALITYAAGLFCLVFLFSFSAAASEFEVGSAIQVYSIEEKLEDVPRLEPNQTPNYDRVFPQVDFPDAAPWAEAVPGQRLVTIDAWLVVPADGGYGFRLTGDGARRLFIHGPARGETRADEPGAIETRVAMNAKHPASIRIEQLSAGDATALRLEWKIPGSEVYELVPAEAWRCVADPTRVTSPGFKRITNNRRPGDGKAVAGVHPGYDLATVRPAESQPSVGAMTFLDDGRLIIGTFNPIQRSDVALPDIDSKEPDQLYEVRGADGDDASGYELVPVAEGLYEPSGLCVAEGELYVSHRRAITRLTDKDGDGFFETHHDVGAGWEGWNYHQFTFGLVHRGGKLYAALSTAMAPPKWEGMRGNSAPNGPMRGGAIEIDLATDTARIVAAGLRTPNTVTIGPDNELFYADNQGTWFPTSVLSHIQPGRFYGHYNNTNVVPNLAERYPDGGHPSALGDQLTTRPAVYLPQNEFINSPSKAILIEEGPFAGQMLLGEITSGGIRRVALEKINGQWQGVAFRFTQGLESGVNRLAWGPDGALYIGGIGGRGNWSWNGTRFGLQRLKPNGKNVFEMHSVRATTDGFHLRFTQPVDSDWLADPQHYAVEQWSYRPTQSYGGPKRNQQVLAATQAVPDRDGHGVRLVIPGLRTGRCVYLRTAPISTSGENIWSTEAYYTLNEIPRAQPLEAATLNGRPIVEAGSQDVGVGLNVLPPPDAVPLIGRSFRGMMFESKVEPKRMPRTGRVTQDDLLKINPARGVEIDPARGDLLTGVEFGDHRLHVEWLAPGRSDGVTTAQTGNSGVYLQGRYELQVLAIPSDTPIDDYKTWEAASLYKAKAPDVNASAGPGQWQSYDVWFRAARFNEQGEKTENARLTAYWNGRLIHDDVELQGPTGLAAQHGEPVREGETILTGPLKLQAHGSDADAPVRFRNVWVAPLHAVDYIAGPTVDLFDGQSLNGWVVNGGRSEFAVQDQTIVGTAVPDAGGNTFLVTEQTYGDFELTYEVKTDSLNSGVQIRSHVDGGLAHRTGLIRGYQVEADPGDRRYSGGIFDQSRRGWIAPLIEKPYARQAWRAGEWNQITVRARGPQIQTWVNGVPAANVFDALTAEGHIALQVHGVGDRADRPQVRFRNLKLRELQPATLAD